MDDLFLLLFLASFICLIIGLVKPAIFSRFVKGEITRKKISLIFGIAAITFFVLFGVTTDSSETKQTIMKNQPTEQIIEQKIEVKNQEETAKNTQAIEEVKTIEYQIVYEVLNKRYDGGNSFYVLIDSIDLSNTQFKEGVKELIRKLVKEKGNKNSFEIHDDKKSLDVSYKQYGDMSLERPRTEEESQIQAIHFIASFDGQLETGIYKNTLWFFPGAFKNHSTVWKYVETVDFDPSK